MAKYISGIDEGTQGVKAAIFDLNGKVMGISYHEYPAVYMQGGWAEQDGELVWRETCAAVRDAIAQSGVDPKDIASVGLSTHRCTTAMVDEKGDCVRRSILWNDRRTTKQCDDISAIVGADRYYDITGLPMDPTWAVSKIMWVRENEPEVFEKTYKFTQEQERFLVKLGADDFYEDHATASLQGLMDIETFEWSDELIDKLGLPKEKLPKLISSAKQVGVVSRKAAEETGFAEGMPIVTGAGDQQCAAIGAGVVKPNTVEITLGSAGVTIAFQDAPHRDAERKLPCSAHAVPGKWISEGLQMAAAMSYKWYRNGFANMEAKAAQDLGVDPYDIINLQIDKVPPGSHGVICLPFFSGAGAPNWDAFARGTFIGLSLAHDKNVMARSILEGVVFEAREILERMENLGMKFEEVIITGGSTKSPLWNQMQADIYGKPCRKLLNEQGSCLGGAILGAVGAGVFPSLTEAVDNLVNYGETYIPNDANRKMYDKTFDIYKRTYQALNASNVYKDLAELDK
jgi:xylulokinase